MANPTTHVFEEPQELLATTTAGQIDLDAGRPYVLGHGGEDETGTASTVTIYVTTVKSDKVGTDPAAPSAAEGSRKIRFISGAAYPIGPGIAKIKFATASSKAILIVAPLNHSQFVY